MKEVDNGKDKLKQLLNSNAALAQDAWDRNSVWAQSEEANVLAVCRRGYKPWVLGQRSYSR